MAFGLWRKPQTIRRYVPSVEQDGYLIPSSHEDFTIDMDVQIVKCETVTDEDGEHSLQKLEVFSDTELLAVDGTRMADRLWYQGKWYECRSSILLDNTVLTHYECEFIQCLYQEGPPDRKEGFPEDGEVQGDNK